MWLILYLAVPIGFILSSGLASAAQTSSEETKAQHLPHRTPKPTNKPMRTTTAAVTRTPDSTTVPTTSKHDGQPLIIEIPDSEGNIKEVDLAAEPNHKLLSDIVRFPSSNMHFLYTRKNIFKPQVLILNNEASINESYYKRGANTFVLIHGFLGDKKIQLNTRVKNALLDYTDANVIVFDWSKLSHADYVTAALGVPLVGKGLGEFLNYLSNVSGNSVKTFHLIGHSLGAHLAGNAGRSLGGQLGRITALDPAGPLWLYNPDSLADQDAQYVEGIHTDGRALGMTARVGHTDFFVNGGEYQPGCVTDVCAHMFAWKIYAVSIAHNVFRGHECESEFDAIINNCNGKELPMGNADINKRGSGIYRVNTKSRYPYY